MIKSRGQHVTNMEKMRNKHVCQIFVGKSEGNRPFRRCGRKCEGDAGRNIRQIK
jgi:hypothetical protein